MWISVLNLFLLIWLYILFGFVFIVLLKIFNIFLDVIVNEGSNVILVCMVNGRFEFVIIWRYFILIGK